MQMNKAALKAGLIGAVLLASAGAAMAASAFATANINVRSGPSSAYGVIDTLQRGQRVEVSGCRRGWCFVEKRGPDGWVSSNYLNGARVSAQPAIRFQFNFGSFPSYQRPGHYDGHHGGHHNGNGHGGNGGHDGGHHGNH
jgi:uncharacterized protein YraI